MAQDSSERSEKCVDIEHGGEAADLLNRYARKGRELHQQLLEQYERELASLMRDMRNGSRGVDLPKTENQTLAEENGLFDAAATASKHAQLAGCAAQFLEDDSASESTTSGSDGSDDTPAFTDDNSRSSVCSSTVSNGRSAGRVPTPAVYALRSAKPANSEPASAPFPGSANVALEKDSAELENRVNGFWRPSNGVDAAISNVYKHLNTTMETKPAPEEPPTTPQTSEADDSAKTGFIRLDLRYNKKILNYVLVETSKQDSTQEDDKWDSYTFAVKRIFNWQNVYQHTLITIHGQELLAVVREILGGVKSLNLRTPKPEIDPKMLYVFLPDFERFIEREEAIDPESAKVVDTKLLMEYLHKDFSQTKANLDGLLKYSEITFDLLWAIFKPNTVVYSICPGSKEPRCARLDRYEYCESHELGRWFRLHCQYIDFDGSAFLPSDVTMDIPEFPGATRIDSMHAYPLSYHKDEAAVRKRLIDLGAKFVALAGSHYRFYDGIAFRWKDKHLQRVNVYSRIMIDAAMFRKVYPSYHSERGGMGQSKERAEDEAIKKVIKDRLSGTQVSLPQPESFARLSKDSLTDEHLLIASPVVLGFSFEHKGYLEFAVANISDIAFSSSAFDKLVLPKKHKSLVQALVMNHCQQSMQPGTSFDDIIEGKGKGLVAVLHGRPGVGKTLTAESICEYLQRPLYAVGAGELGTDATTLETQLAHIVDVAHSWRAVLLLDEADVFMERRSAHELARNALVSVFLRQLERFRGILFLTTNRVENFDEAFQSRIHIAIRYNDLDSKSRKIIFQTFLDRVAREENNIDPDEAVAAEPDDQLRKIISVEDLDRLCRRNLNGRQIKNIVSSAHALANSAGEKLAISHLQTVLEVTEDFQRVMNGQSQIENMMNYA